MRNDLLYYITLFLTVIGALNWGLVGAADINIVKTLFGTMPAVERIVYLLIGASGLVYAFLGISDYQRHNTHHPNR